MVEPEDWTVTDLRAMLYHLDLWGARKMKCKGCALSGLADDVNVPPKLTNHNVVHNRQSQTGALAKRFGREHRVENLGEVLRRNPTPHIAHLQLDSVTIREQFQSDRPAPALAHSVAGVRDQVGHHLRQAARRTLQFHVLALWLEKD